MVEIRNIRYINGIIYADCYPERKASLKFSMEIDTNTREVISISKDEYDAYVTHAKRCLLRYIDQGKPFPEVTGEVWV